ncbi:MAG: hypothetical protein KGI71_05500, partial [Patescibacteria group bacterium]|nr:hypothetical protein [Patescibacteria group bacterium]
MAKGLRQGAASLGESVAGAAEFLSPHGHPFQAIAKGAGDAMRAEAEKYASPQALAQQPWYQRLTNPHAMGQLLGEMAVETAPSLAAFGAGATVGSVGGLPGALATGTLAMAGTIFLQTAGQTFREAQARYLQQGVPTAQAQQQAFRDAGFAGLVSGAVNALGIPASLVAPFRRTLSNLVLQYGLNVGVDTADQITQNVIAQHTFAPERPLSEGVPEAVVGSALLSTPEMLLAAKGARRLQAPPSAAMPAPTTRPLAGIMRQPTVEGAIAQAEQAITGPPVTPSALDAAIAGHRYLEETSSSARPRVAPELDAAIQDQLERFGSREATRTLGAQTPLIEGSPTRGAQEGIEVVTPPRPKRDYLAPTEEEAARTRLQAERENLLAQRRTPAPEPRDLTPSEVELAQVWRTYREATTPEARAAILARAEPAVRSYLREQATLHATPETTMPTTAQIVARRTAGLPASEAPVTPQTVAPPDLQFNGVQHSAGDQPPLELWTLHSPYPGLTEGSTYSRETLERHGVAVPAAPTEPATPHERTSMPEMYGGGEGEVETELPRSPGQPTPAEADKTGPVQTEIPIPPETVGTRPLIGREATPAGAPRIAEGSTPYESAPIFSSQALRVIEQKMPARASREQVRGILSPANGVKPDELKWTGLDDYLKTKDDFSKPEIMEYLRTHQVQLREVQYHAPSASMADNLRALDAAYIESRQRFEQARDESQKGTFRPEAIVAFHRAQAEMQAADLARREAYEQSNSSRPRFENVVLPGGTSYRELLLTLPTHAPVYSSPHWTEPNVLAHVRMDDRTTPDGKRMLFLEEIQSDWHQEGRRTGGVPAAPFAKTWPELVLKRMLRYAAEHGYDELGWTTGAQQAARYDLSKQVDKIVWHEHDGLYDLSATKNSQRMPIKDDVPTDKLEQYVGKDAARKIIEAEQARKQGQSTRTFIEGNDLKVGGDGMQRFYDQILPAFLNRYGKKWGARVQTVDLRGVDQDATPVFNPDTGKDAWPTITVHAIPITEAMRRSVLTSGQALFQNSRPYGRSSADTRQLTLDALGDLDRVVGQVSHERRDLGRATQGASGSSRARFLGLGYRRELIQTGRLDLRGQILRTPEDLAVLGQIVRDPRFETFRIVYLRGTELVGHEAISSRLPGQSLAFVRRRGAPLNLSRAFYDMRDRMRRLRADGYYLLHNHPSGNPTPSLPDRYVTQLYARHVPGFRGHVIVDSGTWGEITAAGDVAVYPLRTAGAVDPLLEAGIPHRLLGATVARAADVATIGKDLQSPARYVAILYVGGNGRVRALQEMPVGLFVRPREATDYLRGRSVETGASRAFAYVAEPSQEVSAAANALIRNGSLIDFVHGAGASRLTSVAPHPTMAFGRMVESVPGYRVSEPGEHATGSLDSSVPPLTTLDAAIRTWLDQFVDVRRMVEGLKAAGQQVSDELNPVYREELYLGRVAHETRQFLSDELLGLTQAMRLSKVTQAQLDRYLYARHAQEANAYLREINPDRDDRDALSGMTDEEADRILKEAPASMERLGRRVDAIVARTRDLMVSYGLESQATIDAWRARYQYYVPLQRAGFEDEGTRGTGSGRDIRGSTVKARLGSNREATNILANIALQRERVIVRGEKMRPVVALAGLMMQYPDHAIATLAKPAPITYTDPETGLQKTVPGDVGDYRVPTIRTLNRRSGQVEVRPDPAYQGRDNVVNFRVDGIDYAIVFNEDNARAVQMARALKGLDIASLNGLLQVVAPVTRFFAAINTQYSPFFGIRNLLRDAGFASLSLSSTPLAGQQRTVARYAIESLRGIYAEARSVRQGEHAEGVAA